MAILEDGDTSTLISWRRFVTRGDGVIFFLRTRGRGGSYRTEVLVFGGILRFFFLKSFHCFPALSLIDFVRNKWLRKTIRYTHFTLSKNGIFAESFYSLNNFVLLLKKNVHVVMRKPSWFGFTDHECHANSIWDSDRRISLPTENDMVKSKGV